MYLTLKNYINHQKRKALNFIENKICIWQLFITFILVVIIFAILFYSLTPGINGINLVTKQYFGFFDSLYFSSVTISTLGYGDLQPLGYSRLLSVIEVFLGFIIMGLLLAKLTSGRISSHVRFLYLNECHQQLSGYSNLFKDIITELEKIVNDYNNVLYETPSLLNNKNRLTAHQKQLNAAKDRYQQSFLSFDKSVLGLKSYVETEVKNGPFLFEVSPNILKDNGNLLNELVNKLTSQFTGMHEDNKNHLLSGNSAKVIDKCIKAVKGICVTVLKESGDVYLKITYSELQNSCKIFQDKLMLVTVLRSELNPPDQFSNVSIDPV